MLRSQAKSSLTVSAGYLNLSVAEIPVAIFSRSFLKHAVLTRRFSAVTFLRDENKIQPVLPPPGPHGVVHYRVEYDLVAVVEGRNLRYEARYPANSSGTVHQVGQISIAAAFRPGTG